MLRLLIVDDEAIIRESLAELTEWNTIGYELIGVCKNGIEAFNSICDEYPDVVITDLKMPILDGLELIERTLKSDKNVQFIILSGYGEFEYAKKAMKFGVKHYLMKPTKKEQVIDALLEIKEEYVQRLTLEQQQKKLSSSPVQFLIQKAFYIELFSNEKTLAASINKYYHLLGFKESQYSCAICSFLEDSFRDSFLHSIYTWTSELNIELVLPILYLRNVAILIFSSDITESREYLFQKIRQIHYPGHTTTPQIQYIVFSDITSLYSKLIFKILRYNEISLCHPTEGIAKISNNNIMPWQIDILSSALKEATSTEVITQLLDDAFHSIDNTTYGIAFASSLYLKLLEFSDMQSSEKSKFFFEDLVESFTVQQIKEMTLRYVISLLFQSSSNHKNIHNIIVLLKDYVECNLSSEELSLKFLAENYLYISVGYLSKQFIKEEGERFSEYLSRKRMEKAKKLLATSPSSNIKDIAEQVGYGNNPRYFSQVFKRYTHLTPSEYIEQLSEGVHPAP